LFVVGPGLLFVVSGPSGAGKDTLVERVMRRMQPRMRYSVSATTRPPRPGEIEGKDYFFLTREEFEERLHGGALLEWREYNGNLYGTPREFVEQTLLNGYDLIMKPEVNGALAIKRAFPLAVLVFLLPDKFSHLQFRLAARRTESTDEIVARLAIAREEMKFIRQFDYLVINEQTSLDPRTIDQPDADAPSTIGSGPAALPAVDDLEAIVRAERFRIHHYDDTTLKKLEGT
jgi:guanylate kinase